MFGVPAMTALTMFQYSYNCWGSQFSAERGILSQATEFSPFHRIFLSNLILAGQMWRFLSSSGTPYYVYTSFLHMKCMTTTRALRGGILKIMNLSEILPVYLVERLYLSLALTGDKYCIFGQFQRL